MFRFFASGGQRIQDSISLVIPVLIFAAVSFFLNTGTPALSLGQPLAPQFATFVFEPVVFSILFGTVLVDAISTLFSSADIYFASQGFGNRWSKIRKGLAARDWLYYMLFSVGWYALFALIAFFTIFICDFIFHSLYVKIGVIAVVAIALFPIFYSGIAIGAFVVLLIRFQNAKLGQVLNTALENTSRVYSFHGIRAFLDLAATGAVPIIFAIVFKNPLLGLILTIIVSGIFLAFTRSASISFKLDLFAEFINE